MSILNNIIKKSGLNFLNGIKFKEISKGRFFQREKTDLGNGIKQFYVILGPNVESPMHNHSAERMSETHLLLYGSGKFIIYDNKNAKTELKLNIGEFHPIFSTPSCTPNHKYIAGPEGSICLAIEI